MESLNNVFKQYQTSYYIIHHQACKQVTQKKLAVETKKLRLNTKIYGCVPTLKVYYTEIYLAQV